MNRFLILSFFFLSIVVLGQESKPLVISIDSTIINLANDIETSYNIGKASKVLLKSSPLKNGKKIEAASGRKSDKYYFEKEHNVIWLKFKTPVSGNLVFTIKPKNPENDYDFLLFKYETEQSINQISTKKVKSIRSNLSRFNAELKGYTGLSFDATQTHVPSGVQHEYSAPLKVEKDEEYFLAIDNVYDNGQGAILEFEYYNTKKISGFVSNENQETKVAADVSWDDAETGTTLKTTKADPKTGYFEMEVPYVIVNPKKMYILAVDAEEYFFDEKMISTAELKALKPEPLNIALTKLKKGNKLKINNIHFQGGLPAFIASSVPSLKRLTKLMKKNTTLKILIEGHTNGCPIGLNDSQLLSERRALRVKKYLFDDGIDVERIQTIGHGCTKMLYPRPETDEQGQLNRRVEILVTEY